MSTVENAEHAREIIIVRHRAGDHDDAPHGGVWKIAFADFMTAMMCFFLVMWLINAANEQTKAAVASYFNPVRLIDRNASRKGLEDPGDGPRDAGLTADSPEENTEKSGQGNDGASSSQKQKSKTEAKQSDNADQRLFADPYAVLAEIATDTAALQNVSEKGDGGARAAGPATGASGGTSYRDPFAPDFWSQQAATPLAEASAERARVEGDPAKPGDKVAKVENPKVKAVAQPAPVPNTAPLEVLAKGDPADAWKKPPPAPEAPDKKAEEKEAEPAQKNEDVASGTTLKAATEIRQQLAQAFKAGDALRDGVSVEATDKGVVISITDRMDFGMFQIGSAIPNRDLVLAMEKIGRIVNAQRGQISIKGHTDARPFRSENYDNWRLSTARAQSAYYMLVRGGVDERRIVEVAGFADRQPKDAADPLAAVNRRIEIFLETGG